MRRRWFGRLTAAAGALLLFCLPLDWSRLGSTLTLAAASIGQPQNTAVLLQQRLQRPVTHVDSGDVETVKTGIVHILQSVVRSDAAADRGFDG